MGKKERGGKEKKRQRRKWVKGRRKIRQRMRERDGKRDGEEKGSRK